jgi:hypothetical protein
MRYFKYIFFVLSLPFLVFYTDGIPQDFQGKAYYFSKSKMELGAWGSRMSEAQKNKSKIDSKPIGKTYILTFNTSESLFTEE